MTPTDPTTDDTVAHTNPDSSSVLGEGLVLFHAAADAGDSGDWKAVVNWMAAHPALAGELATHAADAAAVGGALGPPGLAVRTGGRVGGYELGEKLGGGGMGDVYRAFDAKLERDVAVKVLRAGGFTPMEAAQFRYEAVVAASLNHPNVVRVLASGEAELGPYLVMHLMAGGSLAKWLKARADRKLDPKEAARIVRDVTLGVQHAHERGLIHRDLKPGNILLDAPPAAESLPAGGRHSAGTPHVADFGLARRTDATATTGVAGTPAYMAPEQARGEKGLTTAVDVYALGVILFELLTGSVPYAGLDVPVVLRRVGDESEPLPSVSGFRPDAPADLAAVCGKCLEKRPGDRYRSAQELADDLTNFIEDRPVTARPPGFWDWLRQLARIRPPDSYATPFWPVTAWFGVLIFLTNIAVYALVRADGPATGVWVANSLGGVGMYVVLWWYMLRRFREVPVIDRHSLVLATGCVFLYYPLLAAYVPLSLAVPARAGLDIFPALAAVTGLGLFTLGSTNWSRFFPLGLIMMGLIPLLVRWPDESPLLYGTYLAAVMWYWSYASAHAFHRTNAGDRAG